MLIRVNDVLFLLAAGVLLAISANIAKCDETVTLPSKVEVRAISGSSPTILWAVERVSKELSSLYGIKAVQEVKAKEPFGVSAGGAAQIVLAEQGKPASLRQWLKANGVNSVPTGANAYQVTVLNNPLRVVIVGSDAVGAWYGACAWLDSLIMGQSGPVRTLIGELSGAPALAIRFTRGFDAAPSPDDKRRGSEGETVLLDWWARWRLNIASTSKIEADTPRFLAEAHKRGIKVLLRLGVRNLCASDDKAVADLAAYFDKFLKLGGDGASMLWDDLPRERVLGHCPKCNERFGPKSISQEIIHILEALCDVAAKYPDNKYIVWCPPHYTRERYKDIPDAEFFGAISASDKVRNQTYMYYAQCSNQQVAVLDSFNIKRRVWWYNGLRPESHAIARVRPKDIQTRIKGQVGNSDFPRFDAAGYIEDMTAQKEVRALHAQSDEVWRALHLVGDRFQGMYFCGPTQAYATAETGVFNISPRKFSQAGADRAVFRALFGPGSDKAAREWSNLCNSIEVRLAKKMGDSEQLSAAEQQEIGQLMEQWSKARAEVEACAARCKSLLPPNYIEPMLTGMSEAEEKVRRAVRELSGTTNRVAVRDASRFP